MFEIFTWKMTENINRILFRLTDEDQQTQEGSSSGNHEVISLWSDLKIKKVPHKHKRCLTTEGLKPHWFISFSVLVLAWISTFFTKQRSPTFRADYTYLPSPCPPVHLTSPSSSSPLPPSAGMKIVYMHDDTETLKDAVTLRLTDGVHTVEGTAQVTVLPVNDEKPRLLKYTHACTRTHWWGCFWNHVTVRF